MELQSLPLSALQPSQFYISGQKLRAVNAWLDPADLSNFRPIPVKLLDGRFVMTDGHTRAVAALLAGLEAVPLAQEPDGMDWELYRRCVEACVARGVTSPHDLLSRIISPAEYEEKWLGWCRRMHREYYKS